MTELLTILPSISVLIGVILAWAFIVVYKEAGIKEATLITIISLVIIMVAAIVVGFMSIAMANVFVEYME
jgi:hypothetical protein